MPPEPPETRETTEQEPLPPVVLSDLSDTWLRSVYDDLVDHFVQYPEELREQATSMIEALAQQRAREIQAEWAAATSEYRRASESALRKLGRFLGKKYVRYATAAVLALEVLVVTQEKKEEPLPEIRIEQLDPEATPERMARLVRETLPNGWRQDITGIEYKDQEGPELTYYGLKGVYAAATTDKGTRGSAIVYYRGSKGQKRWENLGSTLTHEVGHANDWERDVQLDAKGRAALKAAVTARVQAADRYRSGYVESINNTDKARELNDKAVEYFAEITRVYLTSEDPSKELTEADRKLVEDYIRKTDPEFDRGRAAERRRQIMRDMDRSGIGRLAAEALSQAEMMSGEERAELAAWLQERARGDAPKIEPAAQRLGRSQLADLLMRWGTDPGRREFARLALIEYQARENLIDDVASERPAEAEIEVEMINGAREGIERARQALPAEEVETFLAQLDGLIRNNDLIVGLSSRGGQLDPGELAELIDWNADDDPKWISRAGGWRIPDADAALDTLLNPVAGPAEPELELGLDLTKE